MVAFSEQQLQRVLADEARAPVVETSVTLKSGEDFTQGPLSIACDGIITGVKSPRVSLILKLDGFLDLDDLNDSEGQEIRVGHWARFRAYEILVERIEGGERPSATLRVRTRPSVLVELDYCKPVELALHQIGRFADNFHLLVKRSGDFEQVLRLELPGVSNCHEDRQFVLGRSGFARRSGFRFESGRPAGDSEHPAVGFEVWPEGSYRDRTIEAAFGAEQSLTLDQVLRFPDGLRLIPLCMRRVARADWRLQLLVQKAGAQAEVELFSGERKEFELLAGYQLTLRELLDPVGDGLPGAVLKLTQQDSPSFELGKPFQLGRGRFFECAQDLQLRYDGFGHAHGTRGVDADGNEIHFARGWYDFSLGLRGEPGHLMITLPQDDPSAPIVGRWRGFQVTVLKDTGGDSLNLRVDAVERGPLEDDAEKIALTEEKETLLVTLWSKAQEQRRAEPIIDDPRAQEILDRIDYDFSALKVPAKTAVMMCLRAARLDEMTRSFLDAHPRGTVLHLGCGLDARCERVDHAEASWFDLDFPEVIALRRRFYAEADGYRMLGSSVTELGWLDQVFASGQRVLVIAEGLMMYLREEEIRALLRQLSQRFDATELAFDAFSKLTAKQAARHPSICRTGATLHWGLDDPQELEAWGVGATVLEEWAFSDSDQLDRLDWPTRALFRMAGWFRVARRAHRIVRIELRHSGLDDPG